MMSRAPSPLSKTKETVLMFSAFPMAAWLLVLIIGLLLWPDPSGVLRCTAVRLMTFFLVPVYLLCMGIVWVFFTGWRILLRVKLVLCLASLRTRHALYVAYLLIKMYLEINLFLCSYYLGLWKGPEQQETDTNPKEEEA
jgi:hypothetical protein